MAFQCRVATDWKDSFVNFSVHESQKEAEFLWVKKKIKYINNFKMWSTQEKSWMKIKGEKEEARGIKECVTVENETG